MAIEIKLKILFLNLITDCIFGEKEARDKKESYKASRMYASVLIIISIKVPQNVCGNVIKT